MNWLVWMKYLGDVWRLAAAGVSGECGTRHVWPEESVSSPRPAGDITTPGPSTDQGNTQTRGGVYPMGKIRLYKIFLFPTETWFISWVWMINFGHKTQWSTVTRCDQWLSSAERRMVTVWSWAAPCKLPGPGQAQSLETCGSLPSPTAPPHHSPDITTQHPRLQRAFELLVSRVRFLMGSLESNKKTHFGQC